jgi:hypothetical protein
MFVLRWALAIGRTARELLASTTSEEITEMMAFESLEPFGGQAADFRAGQIAAIVANVNRDARTRREPFEAADFMPALAAARARARERMQAQIRRSRGPMSADDEAHLFDADIFGIRPQ